jgi:Mg-chelatase subunit ChlD
MAVWTRKTFRSDGVTEYPVGPFFDQLRSRLGGAVVLALDVSGSMQGSRITQAVAGCRRFIKEATEDGYTVGVMLWHHGVESSVVPSQDLAAAHRLLDSAVAAGGNDAVPFLSLAHRQLMALNAGDRVVAIFGDGDLGDPTTAQAKAAELIADNIRILTCGLGGNSAEALAVISTETAAPRTASEADLADTIASMASGLRRR